MPDKSKSPFSGDDDNLSEEDLANIIWDEEGSKPGKGGMGGGNLTEDSIAELLKAGAAGGDDDMMNEEDMAGILMEEGGAEGPDLSAILNQTDIDAIMAEASLDTQTLLFRHNGQRVKRGEKLSVEEYDFSNPVFMTEAEMRQVRIRHEQFVHHLSARLSMFLRMDVGLKMSKLYTTQYQNHTSGISNPTHISLFKIEQFNGVGIVDMNPRLAMTMVDRLLGGRGHSIRGERYLTDLEIVMVEDVIEVILTEWCHQWQDIQELDATIIGHENNGRFLQTSPRDTILLVVIVEAILGDCTESLEIAIPYYTIQPVLKKLQDDNKKHSQHGRTEKVQQWSKNYDHIKVPISAEWKGFACTVRDLLMLRPGDVVMMPEGILEQTHLRMNNTVPFKGKVGVQNGHIAVQVTEQILNLK